MKSISTLTIIAATALFGNAIAAPAPEPSTVAYKALTYKGCFSSGDGLTKNSTYTYNSKGYCQTQCVPIDYAVQATYNSDECWCGDDLPPADDLVDDSKCDSPCAGINTEMCGGTKLYWSVYLTGTESSAPNYDPAAAASSSAASAASAASVASASRSTASPTTSTPPSVVTLQDKTVTVQASNAAAASSSAAALSNNDKSSSGPNKAGIAAGVVVGVLVAAAVAGGIFILMRNKKRREVEEEYRRNAAVNNFATGGKSPVSSGGASFTDTRLDPTLANRRMSDGSIADNQDYSRRILKVCNQRMIKLLEHIITTVTNDEFSMLLGSISIFSAFSVLVSLFVTTHGRSAFGYQSLFYKGSWCYVYRRGVE
ncbi:hypothetical protein EYC80_007783 [Monilinia laxa]|uniref:WSC domain-containing protein n=1 Tax=Monilinia laxa TaxID=61186 RepID=A0A5N6JWZ3_MONLA|nr:hypothetical protein EYC80_007783 [Monilinia laxa]